MAVRKTKIRLIGYLEAGLRLFMLLSSWTSVGQVGDARLDSEQGGENVGVKKDTSL